MAHCSDGQVTSFVVEVEFARPKLRTPVGTKTETPEKGDGLWHTEQEHFMVLDPTKVKGTWQHYHTAEDWNIKGLPTADLGKPVFAFAKGKVVKVVDTDKTVEDGLGKYVVLITGIGDELERYRLPPVLDLHVSVVKTNGTSEPGF